VFAVSWAAFPPLILLVLAVGFGVYCLVDLVRAPSVKRLPKWAWALLILVSEPLGGILYLLLGRDDRE
jgi:hypothetical protein